MTKPIFVHRQFALQHCAASAGVRPLSIAHLRVSGRRSMHTSDRTWFHLVVSGGIELASATDPPIALGPGDLFIIHPHRPYAYYERTDELAEIYALSLEGPFLSEWLEDCGFTGDRRSRKASDPPAIRQLLGELIEEARGSDRLSMLNAIAALYRLPAYCTSSSAQPHEPDDLATRVLWHIESHIDKGENVEDLAHLFDVSRQSLFLHFKKRFNTSPINLITKKRLLRGKHLLEASALPVNEIARLSGYSNSEHFSRKFKQHYTESPQNYRERIHG